MSKIGELKKKILQVCYKAQEGHIASSFSILNILYILYNNILNINKNNLKDNNRDIFILSKGHASIGLSVILRDKGFIEESDLDSYCEYDSILGGHLDKNKVNGVEASTGSLGHGLPIAVGYAMSKKIQNNSGKVYVLIGDGELNEGSNWESIILAKQHKLDNLVLIIDYNKSNEKSINLGNIEQKMLAFGWDVESITGHNHFDIYNALKQNNKKDKPYCIVAHTIKGYGSKTIENNLPEYHHKIINSEELLNKLISEIEEHENQFIYNDFVKVGVDNEKTVQ